MKDILTEVLAEGEVKMEWWREEQSVIIRVCEQL